MHKASNESKTTATIGSKVGEKEESNSKEITSTHEIEKEKDTTNRRNKGYRKMGQKCFTTGHRHRLKLQEKICEEKVLSKHKYWDQLIRKRKHEARGKCQQYRGI